MKKSFHLLFFIVLIIISCNKKENKEIIKILHEIQAIGDTFPKAAIKNLDSIKPLLKNESNYILNKIALLDTRLHDKAYITHTTDSVIKEVCHYFEKHGTAKEIQEAYYYMGSVYRDMNDCPNAVNYFLKSISIAENEQEFDTLLWRNANSQLSLLYRQQFKDKEALNIILKSVAIEEENGIITENTYISVANCFFNLNDTLQTIKYTNLALNIIESEKSYVKNADIIANAMGKYAKLKYKQKAEYCHNLLQVIPEDSKPSNLLINLAIYYQNCVSIDSAATIRVKLYNKAKSIEEKYDAAEWLTIYYTMKENYNEVAKYAINFIKANEEIIEKRNLEQTAKTKNLYQYNRNKEKEQLIIQKAADDRLHLILAIFISILILFFFLTIHYYRKKQLLNIILSKDNDIKQIIKLKEQKEKELIIEKQNIEKNIKELVILNSKNSELTKQIKDAQNNFKLLIAQNKELTKLTFMNSTVHNAEAVIEKCKKSINGKHNLSNEEWKELLSAIDKQYPDFIDEIQNKFKKINEPTLRICYLLKIGLSKPEIANLTNYPRQTVWDRVKRIEKVLGYNFHQPKK